MERESISFPLTAMKSKCMHIVVLIQLLLFCAVSANAQGDLLTHVEVAGSTISPDGDGYQDSLRVTYTLADTAWSASAYILTSDPPQTIIDILMFEAPRSAGTYTIIWDGNDFSGIPAPEGRYRLLVQAMNGADDDSVSKDIFVDLTPPSVSITRVEPGIFSPDIRTTPRLMTVDFTVSNSPPGNEDQIRIIIEDPAEEELATLSLDSTFAGNGGYTVTWDGAEIAADGLHRIVIIVSDNAGYSATDWATINIDNKAPALQVLEPPNSAVVSEVPASLTGWTWDRNGVNADSLRISFSGEVFIPITSTTLSEDTVYFTVPLTDSITDEKLYTLLLQSQDVVGRQTQISHRITYDATAPSAPVLAQPAENRVRKPVLLLSGTVAEEPDVVRLFRNGALVDSITGLIGEDISREMPLIPGANTFTAIAIDDAGNISPTSNAVTVTFDNTAGLFIPQPFQPGDEFQLNLVRAARAVELRVYDLKGNLVTTIDVPTAETAISVTWNGLNGDDKSLQRGPLVLVASITYADGGSERKRELFLFKP